MDKNLLKDHLLQMQKNVILELEEVISSKHSMVDLDEGDTMDPEDYSHQYESGEMEQLISTQLNKAKRNFDLLNSIDFGPKKTIQPGALVETSKFNFIIGQATVPFDIDGKHIVGVSVDSPIYPIMVNKKEGDQFSYCGIDYKIIKIN